MSSDEKNPTAEGGEHASQPAPQPAAEGMAAQPEEKAADVRSLQLELEDQKRLAGHNLDQWKRAAADLENYRKRVERERAELLKLGTASLMKTLLPVLDDFERAFQTCPEACHHLTWTEGVALIDRRLRLALEQQGLREIQTLGKPFDPAVHEVFGEEENAAYADGHVSAVLQRGYMLHDRVLRPAIVRVARNKPASTATEAGKSESVDRPQDRPSNEAEGRSATNEQE